MSSKLFKIMTITFNNHWNYSMLAAEIVSGLVSRGVTLAVREGKLSISPRSLLTQSDQEAILDHQEEIRRLLDAQCPGTCPGACEAACRGGPSPTVELLFPSGLTGDQWCRDGFDRGAGWFRHRGVRAWRRIPGRTFPRPPVNVAMGIALVFEEEDDQ